jgi:protein-S-isoprenylcysteine O-methyltransferase Ste14
MSARAIVFKNRGALLAIPALILVILGKPSVNSIIAGLGPAFAGEGFRCLAVGYSGITTRADHVVAPQLVTAGPYAYLRNPLYVGNFLTAFGFALAFTGNNPPIERLILIAISLAVMIAVYVIIVPHEEEFLRTTFGAAYDDYAAHVPRVWPRWPGYYVAQHGAYDPSVIARAESRTFVFFGLMLIILLAKAFFQ